MREKEDLRKETVIWIERERNEATNHNGIVVVSLLSKKGDGRRHRFLVTAKRNEKVGLAWKLAFAHHSTLSLSLSLSHPSSLSLSLEHRAKDN